MVVSLFQKGKINYKCELKFNILKKNKKNCPFMFELCVPLQQIIFLETALIWTLKNFTETIFFNKQDLKTENNVRC